jgi:protein TonB
MSWGAFGGYDVEGPAPRQNWWLAALLALGGYAAIFYALIVLPPTPPERPEPEKPREVTFQELVPTKVEPPPQPVAEPAPVAAAPVIPKRLKVRKVEAAPPPKPLVAPKEMPKEAPREADPSEDKGVAVVGDPALGGDPAGREGGVAGANVVEAIALPENADPPTPLPSNRPPTYPQQARAEGRTGVVVLKVVIAADGSVADVSVLRGEEPFVSAAVSAVRQWRYKPAVYQGKPITVYRIIQIPFKIQA